MTRIFEVNIGNIAACIPILKPFARYVHAKVTGKDPHQIFQRSARDSEMDRSWHRHRWRIPWQRSGSKEYTSRQPETDLPPNVMKMRAIALEEAATKGRTTRTGSIALPLQGTQSQEDIPNVPEIHHSHYFQSGRTPESDSGEFFGVKEVV